MELLLLTVAMGGEMSQRDLAVAWREDVGRPRWGGALSGGQWTGYVGGLELLSMTVATSGEMSAAASPAAG